MEWQRYYEVSPGERAFASACRRFGTFALARLEPSILSTCMHPAPAPSTHRGTGWTSHLRWSGCQLSTIFPREALLIIAFRGKSDWLVMPVPQRLGKWQSDSSESQRTLLLRSAWWRFKLRLSMLSPRKARFSEWNLMVSFPVFPHILYYSLFLSLILLHLTLYIQCCIVFAHVIKD
jgi:hypothetical protein